MPLETMYKDRYPTLTLDPDNPDPKKRFSFGVKKAALIMRNLDAIKAFNDKHNPAAAPAARNGNGTLGIDAAH